MSYLAVDLDALNVMPDVASAAGITPGAVAHGLLKLWAWCFREEVEVVSEVHLRGFFGVDAGPALEAFGFLSRHDGSWRVRGAQRYLKIKQAQREGGKKGRAKSSSRVGMTQISTSAPPQGPLQGPPQPPLQGPNRPLHRTPNTEHRTPSTEEIYPGPGELFESVPPTTPPTPTEGKPPKPPKPAGPHPLQVIWNENRAPSMPEWRETGKTRRKHADARFEERSTDEWVAVVKRIAASDFASGRTGKWAATPDFLVQPDSATKVLEGAYDNRAATVVDLRKPQPPGSFTVSRNVEDF